MATPAPLKRLLRRSVPLKAAAFVAQDCLCGIRLALGMRGTDDGTMAAAQTAAATADYCEGVYRSYLRHAEVPAFRGAVAEIGPGDTLGVGLLVRAGGAAEYHAIDRYRPRCPLAVRRAVHQELATRTGRGDLVAAAGDAEDVVGVRWHVGAAAETFFRRRALAFDAVLSNAVLEHLTDPVAALDGMLGALRPGGVMVHVIDHRDHGMFAGRHPLTFLTLPDWVYRPMVRWSARPNRVLHGDYAAWLRARAVAGRLLVTWLVDGSGGVVLAEPLALAEVPSSAMAAAMAEVAAIRPRLATRFRSMNDQELSVAGSVLVVRKIN